MSIIHVKSGRKGVSIRGNRVNKHPEARNNLDHLEQIIRRDCKSKGSKHKTGTRWKARWNPFLLFPLNKLFTTFPGISPWFVSLCYDESAFIFSPFYQLPVITVRWVTFLHKKANFTFYYPHFVHCTEKIEILIVIWGYFLINKLLNYNPYYLSLIFISS